MTARSLVAALAALTAIVGVHPRNALAAEARALPGLALRNSEWISKTGLALAPVGPTSSAALTARLELGPAGTGAALGVMTIDGGKRFPAIEHAGVELEAVRAYGPLDPSPTTYVGPQLAAGSWSRQVTLGWLFDVEDPDNNHPQLGVGLGF